jgi:hypothetical protein
VSTFEAEKFFRSRRRRIDVAAGFVIVGLITLAVGIDSTRSNADAAALYHQSESCQLHDVDEVVLRGRTRSYAYGACRTEPAAVVGITEHAPGGGLNPFTSRRRAYVITHAQYDNHDTTPIAGFRGRSFLTRISPGQSIILQRFMTRGYHITDSVTAFADSNGWAESAFHPDHIQRYGVPTTVCGLLFLIIGVCLMTLKGSVAPPVDADRVVNR